MPKTPADADPQSWHRCFAMEANNRAWSLAVATRDAALDAEMLDAAHASAWHWAAAGTELHRMRATMLLAEVHALVGDGLRALDYAEAMRAYFLARETPDWELAFTHAIYAHAAHCAGEDDAHRAAWHAARAAIEAIADDEDRNVVLQTFALVPVPVPTP